MATFVQSKQSKVGSGKAIGGEINKIKNQSAKDKVDKKAKNPVKETAVVAVQDQTKQEPQSSEK